MAIKLSILFATLGICLCFASAKAGNANSQMARFFDSTRSDPCPVIDISQMIIKEDTCEKHLAFIKNIKVREAASLQWINDSGNTVGYTTDLENVSMGRYQLIASSEGCTVKTQIFEIKNHNLSIGKRYDSSVNQYVSDVTFYLPDSGRNNGSILINSLTGTINEPVNISWRNGENRVSGTGLFLDKVPADMYTVTLESANGCKNTAATYILPNYVCKLGFDDNRLNITPALCNKATGSIKGMVIINASGKIAYQWTDSSNRVVGSEPVLTNAPGGRYRLQFIDESRCDTIRTPYYSIESPGAISLETTGHSAKPSQCVQATGAITGISASGATIFEWRNADGTVISNELNPGSLFPGKYILNTTNAYGCEAATDSIAVPVSSEMASPTLFQLQQQAPRCDSANGSAVVTGLAEAQSYTFRWVDSAREQVTLSETMELKMVPAGSYFLYAKNVKGCEQKITAVRFDAMPAARIDISSLQTGNDLCEQGIGFIKGLKISSGTPPFILDWQNEHNKAVGNDLDIGQLLKGRYTLQVSDKMNCKDSKEFTIINQTLDLQKPRYNSITILKNSPATLRISNYQPGNYLLFDAPDAVQPVQVNNNGNFTTSPLHEDKAFYVLLKTGACESERGAAEVKVVDETRIFVPNGFTPNNDGKNDLLKPVVYGLLEAAQFIVYDRWGTAVFRTKDLSQGWNGRNGGKEVPPGIYVWSLVGKDIKGNHIQKQGTVTLIR